MTHPKIAVIQLDAFPVNCVFCMREIWPREGMGVAYYEGELVDPDLTGEWARGWSCIKCYTDRMERP